MRSAKRSSGLDFPTLISEDARCRRQWKSGPSFWLGGYVKIVQRSLLAVVSLAGACGAASAATQVVNCGTASGPTELVAAAVVCAQFNIGGATLQSVQITLSGNITGNLVLNNNTTAATTGSATTTSSASAGALAGFSFANPVFAPSFTTGTQPVAAGQTITFSGLSGNGSVDLGTNSITLAPYIGAGNFNIPVTTSTSSSVQGGGGSFHGSGATTGSVTAVVTYTYTGGGG